MPQSINYTNPTADFDALIELIRTSLRFGLIHEDTVNDIENVVREVTLKREEFAEDKDEYEWCGLEELFDTTEDKEFFVELLRTSYFVHTNYDNLWEYDDVAQLILDLMSN